MNDNLIAWAITQGFDPMVDYGCDKDTEGDEPPLSSGRLSANFTETEFRCRGSGALPLQGMDPRLIDALQSIRDHFGVPVTITSGYRSEAHNAAVGGSPNSQHRHGRAADFVVRGVCPLEVFRFLDGTWPGGLGRYRTFTHIDTRPQRARW